MKTYIFTRLNVKCAEFRELTDEYCKYRLDLYKISTLKSIKNQTNQDFINIVVSDISLSDEMKDYTNSICDNVIYVDYENKEWNHKHISELLAEWNTNNERICTINIDSDDLLHSDFVNNVYEESNKLTSQELPGLIFCKKHYLLSEKRGFDIIIPDFINSNLAFIEDKKPYETCWRRGHANMNEQSKTIIYDNSVPMCMLVHATNYCSRYFDPYRSCEKIFINLKDKYGISQSEVLEFLTKDLPEQFIKDEEDLRNIRRSKSNKNKPKV